MDDECELCGGSGQISIAPIGLPENAREDYGCPLCIERERNEEEARAELEEWRFTNKVDELYRELDKTKAKLAEAEKDAARWRAFRAADSALTLRLHNTRIDYRDAEIDAAIAAQEKS